MPLDAPNLESSIAKLKLSKNSFEVGVAPYNFPTKYTVVSGKQVRRCLEQHIDKQDYRRNYVWKARTGRSRDVMLLPEKPEVDHYYSIYRVGNDQFVVVNRVRFSDGETAEYDVADPKAW